MKKIAFFVEGQTEQLFLNKLLIEIAGSNNIAIELKKFKGKGKPTIDIFPKNLAQPINPNHSALIYDCGGDESVKSRILEEYTDLINDGFIEIVGIRDLFPLTDLVKLESRLLNGLLIGGVFKQQPLPSKAIIIVAVNEIESWFLAECNHFKCIDLGLTSSLIAANLTYNPCLDDMTLLPNPAEDLKNIYSLVGKVYNKDKKVVQKTVECLDYANMYLNVRPRIQKLDELINRIDNFLT